MYISIFYELDGSVQVNITRGSIRRTYNKISKSSLIRLTEILFIKCKNVYPLTHNGYLYIIKEFK